MARRWQFNDHVRCLITLITFAALLSAGCGGNNRENGTVQPRPSTADSLTSRTATRAVPTEATTPATPERATRSLRVALIGDSLAYGAGDEARKGIALRLPAELEERGISETETINLGVNGARTGDLASRLARPEIRAKLTDVDAIILSIGANDLFATPGARENLLRSPLVVANQILERVATIVTELRSLNPDAKILIIGGYNPVPWHAQAKLIDQYLGLWDAAVAGRFEEDRNIAVVKMSDLVDAKRLSRLDKFHPGGDAYQAAAERIADLLV